MPHRADDAATSTAPPADPFAPPAPGTHPQRPAAQRLPQHWSRLGITAFVLGLLGFLAPLWLVSGTLALVALRRISRLRQRGVGLAIAGLLLSFLWLVATAVVAGIALLVVHELESGPERGADGRPAQAGRAGPWYLRQGDCLTDDLRFLEEEPGHYDVVPCGQPHHTEIYAVVRIPGGIAYPGEAAVDEAAERLCAARDTEASPSGPAPSRPAVSGYNYPQAVGWWLGGDHEALCYHTAADAWPGPLRPAPAG
ncbi:hypothetical protein ACIGZJ_18345 [Kitasatospora sp. NPDC052868]|uniref:hypothetical protein n=1 Tax=Kitasatospora sp. NPDC052868 TaxID=3364060 RepID=UPI0037CC77F0